MDNNRCAECGIEFISKRKDAKYCSSKCRKDSSRKASIVTDNVTLNLPEVKEPLEVFEFTASYSRKPGDVGYDEKTAEEHAKVRTAVYWYDVPIQAVPVLKKGWPEVPTFNDGAETMNGRQYFLWWKNNFEIRDATPVIHNPFPVYDKVEYVKAGEGSRYWGTV